MYTHRGTLDRLSALGMCSQPPLAGYLWWRGDGTVDAEIKRRFEHLLLMAEQGQLDHWVRVSKMPEAKCVLIQTPLLWTDRVRGRRCCIVRVMRPVSSEHVQGHSSYVCIRLLGAEVCSEGERCWRCTPARSRLTVYRASSLTPVWWRVCRLHIACSCTLCLNTPRTKCSCDGNVGCHVLEPTL